MSAILETHNERPATDLDFLREDLLDLASAILDIPPVAYVLGSVIMAHDKLQSRLHPHAPQL